MAHDAPAKEHTGSCHIVFSLMTHVAM